MQWFGESIFRVKITNMAELTTIEFPTIQNDLFHEQETGRTLFLKDLVKEMSKIKKKKGTTVEKVLADVFGFNLEEKERVLDWVADTVRANGQKNEIKQMTVSDFLGTYGKMILAIRSADDAKRRLLAMK